jgi:hypothetical protein
MIDGESQRLDVKRKSQDVRSAGTKRGAFAVVALLLLLMALFAIDSGSSNSLVLGVITFVAMIGQMAMLPLAFSIIDRRAKRSGTLMELCVGSALSIVYMLAVGLFVDIVVADKVTDASTWSLYLESMILGEFVFGLWVLGFRYPKMMSLKDASEAETQRLLHITESNSLQARLHPHFLLNTLNAVAAEVGQDARRARAMLAQLGELIRRVLKVRNCNTLSARRLIFCAHTQSFYRYDLAIRSRFDGRSSRQ